MSQFHSMFLNHDRLAQAITEEQEETHKHKKDFLKLLHAAYLLTSHWPKQVTWPKSESKGQENRLK